MFCQGMRNFTLNEKNNLTNTLEGSSSEDLGIVAYYHNATSNFDTGGKGGKGGKGFGKGGKGGKGFGKGGKGFGKGGKELVNNTSSIEDVKLTKTLDFVFDNINKLEIGEKRNYWIHFVKTMFLVRDHKDGNGARLYFYKTFMRLYNELPGLCIALLPLLTGSYNLNGEIDEEKPFGSILDLNNIYELCGNDIKFKGLKVAIVNLYIKCLMIDKYKPCPSLAVKWIPRENKKYDRLAKDIALNMFIDDEPLYKKMEKYRKFIGSITKKINIVETLMTENRWDEIEPEQIPSRALRKYLYALKNEIKKTGEIRDPNNINKMICREKMLFALGKSADKSNIKVSGLYPHEIIKSVLYEEYMTDEEKNDIIALWNKYELEWHKSLETENISDVMDLVIMSDVSLSMSGTSMEACIALSLLFANRLNGVWNNKVLTFDSQPQWHEIPKELDIIEKIKFLHKAPWGGSTNIGLALDMILTMAIKNKLLPNDMPSKLLILSDMQFDQACTYGDKFLTGFEHLENKFIENGYSMPAIIFWNLRGDTYGYENKSNQKGTTTLSGFSPSLFKSFMGGNFNIKNTPWDTLKDLIDSDRLKKLDKIFNIYI